ncbi:36094_t:CDS:2, partial [Gigaspora margarita]
MLHTYTGLISLIFDLWTSRAHDSYLGVTCHWISDKFRMNDLTLGVIELGAYKTANDIVEFLEPMLEEFGIEKNKILSITTDNGANVKAAVTKLLTSLLVSKLIANIFCATHTLQLSVNAGLEVASDLIIKCKTLISLMTTEILFRSTYTTLSIMVPTIRELIYHLENTISKLDIISDVKDTILSDLSRRWSSPHKYGMYASLLDPRFKNLSFSSSKLKEETIKELQEQFNELNGQTNQVEGDEASLPQVVQTNKGKKS